MNFRRVLTALAVPALFAGLASAQVINPSPISCSVSAATSPSVRSEGIADRVGDLLITCTSGPSLADNTAADRATITVKFGAAVTSRVDANIANVGKPSEALLLIDEPNTVTAANAAAPNYGQNAAISVCTVAQSDTDAATTQANCPVFKQTVNNFYVMSTTAGGVATPGAANAYQGAVTGTNSDTIKIYNVPVMAPGPNATRTYRLVNVRLTPGTAPVDATVSVSAAANAQTTLSLSNASATVANPQISLNAKVTPVGGISLCTSAIENGGVLPTESRLATLTFAEAYNNAFKTRVLSLANNAGDTYGNGAGQVAANGSYKFGPTTITNALSESGVVVGAITPGGVAAGLADSGTRFKAVFAKLPQPSKAKFYVSITNIIDYSTTATAPTAIGDRSNVSYAVYVGQGAAAETAAAPNPGVAVAATTGNINLVQIVPDDKGNAEVVWELTNGQRNAVNTLNFGLYVVYNNVTNTPTIGNTATVQLGYAPTDGADAPGVTQTWIPRFAAPTATAATFFNVLPCQTTLLFPFVTNLAGYETGIAISNTSADTFGTTNSNGKCALNFFGAYSGTGTAPTNPVWMTDPSDLATAVDLQAGKTVANTASLLLGANVGFQGYMMAVCNFQYAHGFAYILNSTNAAMGYLANVVANTNRGSALLGEQLGN